MSSTLIVRPTGSVLRYRSAEADPLVAGRDLGVGGYIVDGSLRRAGSRIRVMAQLISIAEGCSQMGGTFDEESTDVLNRGFDLGKSNRRVAATTDGRRAATTIKTRHRSAEAFESYLRGRYYWNSYTESRPGSSPGVLQPRYRA